MANKNIFVNLPVKDLDKSIRFFTEVGYTFNPQFTDETCTCMVISENIFVMLLTQEKFLTFSPNPICDTSKNTEVLTCFSCDSREEVDALVAKAIKAGGKAHMEPRDLSFMYTHAYRDLDGHVWELFYMDPAQVPQA